MYLHCAFENFLILIHIHPSLLLSDFHWEMTPLHCTLAVVQPHHADHNCQPAGDFPDLPDLAPVVVAVSWPEHLGDVEEQLRQHLPLHCGRTGHHTSSERECNGPQPRLYRTKLYDHL